MTAMLQAVESRDLSPLNLDSDLNHHLQRQLHPIRAAFLLPHSYILLLASQTSISCAPTIHTRVTLNMYWAPSRKGACAGLLDLTQPCEMMLQKSLHR